MHRRTLILVWLVVLSLAQGARAQDAPPTLAEYEQIVREAYAAASRSDRIGLDDAAARLLTSDEVQLPDGSAAPADNRWLTEALAVEPPDYRLIEARLGAILDAAGQTRNAQDPNALNKLDEVFAQPPFRSREVPSAWTRFWRAVGDTISNFFDRLGQSLPNPPTPTVAPPTPSGFSSLSPLGWLLLIVGGLLILGLVIYAIRGVRQSLVRDARARADAIEEETITATEALDRAQDQARSGDYRTAVRYLYLSSLLWLDERKLLRYDRSLTNREYLAEVRNNPALHAQLAPVVNTFDQVWYGHGELAEEDFRAYEAQVQGLRDMEQRS